MFSIPLHRRVVQVPIGAENQVEGGEKYQVPTELYAPLPYCFQYHPTVPCRI